jgi:hypothetical protein
MTGVYRGHPPRLTFEFPTYRIREFRVDNRELFSTNRERYCQKASGNLSESDRRRHITTAALIRHSMLLPRIAGSSSPRCPTSDLRGPDVAKMRLITHSDIGQHLMLQQRSRRRPI